MAYLEEEFKRDINEINFIPFLMLHEFEAFVFCQTEKIVEWVDSVSIDELSHVAAQFNSPEEINDSVHTAPSKRILRAVPKYQKTLHGPMIVEDIGIDVIRSKCVHFHAWVEKLENM